MWPFNKSLDDVLSKTKDVRVQGVKFRIKKIDITNYLDGSKIMMQAYDTYKVGKPLSPEADKILSKLKDHYVDVFMSAVLSPQLKRKPEDHGILVDNLFTEWTLAHELYNEIMMFTYGKKKISLSFWPRISF